MAKENENLESTEETVEEVVADKDAEQEHLDRQKEEEESIALASEKAKEKLNVLKLKRHVMLVNQAQVVTSLEVLPL